MDREKTGMHFLAHLVITHAPCDHGSLALEQEGDVVIKLLFQACGVDLLGGALLVRVLCNWQQEVV
jgi:hypothetical protein